MEFPGLSVNEDRNLASSAVGYAYLGNGFFFVRFAYSKIQALVMVENGIKIPVPSGYFWSPYGKY